MRQDVAHDPNVHIGPLVSARQRERVEGYIQIGKDEGGKLTTGGGRPAEMESGWYVEPTVFAGFDNSATLAKEEIFGPVLTIIPCDDIDAPVVMANDSDYGLGGTAWTEDPERGAAVDHPDLDVTHLELTHVRKGAPPMRRRRGLRQPW